MPNDELNELYHQLKLGLARDRVTDNNVFALIDLAVRYGDKQLETLLREWQAPCTDDAQAPTIAAPTPGFNRENTKH